MICHACKMICHACNISTECKIPDSMGCLYRQQTFSSKPKILFIQIMFDLCVPPFGCPGSWATGIPEGCQPCPPTPKLGVFPAVQNHVMYLEHLADPFSDEFLVSAQYNRISKFLPSTITLYFTIEYRRLSGFCVSVFLTHCVHLLSNLFIETSS